MEELVGFLAGDLETYETEALPGNDWLLALAAMEDGSKLHGLPPERCLLFPVGQFFS